MIVQDLIKSITDHFSTTAQVNAVFGDSRQIGRKTIIPIATVSTGFGVGGGEGKQARENEPAQEGTGGGGGGGAQTRPLAVLEVTDEETRLIPVIDVTRIVLASLMFAGMATCMITKLLSRGRNK